MKKLLWRPGKISWKIHVLIAIIALSCLSMVETMKVNRQQPFYREKLKAARIMMEGMNAIKLHRIRYVMPIDNTVDPLHSGMIGVLTSPVTSVKGDYDAKLATINPNWAAAMVAMLKSAGVRKGDTVCTAFSGSFPALNLAVLSAARALDLKVVSISSAAASTWGANVPGLLWIDMERILRKKGIVSYSSVAASLGGSGDQARGMKKKGRDILLRSILMNGLEFIDEKNKKMNIDKRMEIYQKQAGSGRIAAFINSGGGTISVGTSIGKRRYRPGLNKRPSSRAMRIDSVMTRFARMGVPVIHLSSIKVLARKYRLPADLKSVPPVGTGTLYMKLDYNKYLAFSSLIVIVICLFIFIRQGRGQRLFSSFRKSDKSGHVPGHMV